MRPTTSPDFDMPTPLSNEHNYLLNARRLPARLTVFQTGVVLGFEEHDVPVLVKHGLLRPLSSNPNCVKYFARVDVEELAKNTKLLAKATTFIGKYWKLKNSRKSSSALKRSNGHTDDLDFFEKSRSSPQ